MARPSGLNTAVYQSLDDYSKGLLVNAIKNQTPFLNAVEARGLKKRAAIGRNVKFNVVAHITTQGKLIAGNDAWAFAGDNPLERASTTGTIWIRPMQYNLQDEMENADAFRVTELVRAIMIPVEQEAADRIERSLIRSNTSNVATYASDATLELSGLPDIVHVSAAAASDNTLYGIDRSVAANSYFQNAIDAVGAVGTNAATLIEKMHDMKRTLQSRGARADLIVSQEIPYSAYVRGVQASLRRDVPTSGIFVKLDQAYKTPGVLFEGAEVIYDHNLEDTTYDAAFDGDECMYFVDSSMYRYVVQPGNWDMYVHPWVRPKGDSEQLVNKTFMQHKWTAYHQNPRNTGVLYDISAT